MIHSDILCHWLEYTSSEDIFYDNTRLKGVQVYHYQLWLTDLLATLCVCMQSNNYQYGHTLPVCMCVCIYSFTVGGGGGGRGGEHSVWVIVLAYCIIMHEPHVHINHTYCLLQPYTYTMHTDSTTCTHIDKIKSYTQLYTCMHTPCTYIGHFLCTYSPKCLFKL